MSRFPLGKRREIHDLFSFLKHIYSTGSPLPGTLYDFIYQHIHPNVLVGSITGKSFFSQIIPPLVTHPPILKKNPGGTDICSLFAGQNTSLPVFRGEIQCRMLGMAVEAWTPDGKLTLTGEAGDLVCVKPFPCQPVGFWPLEGFGGDEEVERARERYRMSYFGTFEGVWCEFFIILTGCCDW